MIQTILKHDNRRHLFWTAIAAKILILLLLTGGAEAATEIGACTNISSSGEYVLNMSISNNASSICININASDVIFNGAGYTIDGINSTNTYGVYVNNSATTLTNVTVKNLTVTDWRYGIYYYETNLGIIQNITASSNTLNGVFLKNSTSSTISGTTVTSNGGDGIALYSSSNNTLSNNTAKSNTRYGIYLATSSNNNNLTNNTASSSNNMGIYITSSSSNTFTNNTATANDQVGIYLVSSNNGTFTSNNASSNNGTGISFSGSNNNTLTSNTVNDNNNGAGCGYGIRLSASSSNNTFVDNTVRRNICRGFEIGSGSNNNTLRNNTMDFNLIGVFLSKSAEYNLIDRNNISSNTESGIREDDKSYNTYSNNTLIGNTDYGIRLYDTHDDIVSNNTISGSKYGIHLSSAHSNIIEGNNLSNNNVSIYLFNSNNNNILENTANNNNWHGISITSSDNNTFTSNTALNNTQWDFYSTTSSLNNTVTNLNINFTISFTSKDIAIRGTTAPTSDPSGYRNISKFVNATNSSADSWLFLNVSYSDNDISGLIESSLKVWKYNGTVWSQATGTSGVNTASNYAFANITNFSIFALFGTVIATTQTSAGGGGGSSSGSVMTLEPYDNIVKAERYDKNLVANTPVTYTFKAPELGIYNIVITGKENENYIVVMVELLKDTSKLVNVLAPGTVYKNVNIWTGTKRMKEASIRFKVDNSWLENNNLASSDVKMVKWDGSKWVHLETMEKNKDVVYTYYEAKTHTFSAFAISGLKSVAVSTATPTIEVTRNPITPTEKASGFGLGLFIVTLLAINFIRQKKCE